VIGGKTPAQTPVSRPTDELDRRLLATLAAHEGPAGICPRIPRLAALLGVSESTLHRALRRLVAAGQLERIAVFERDDDPEWQRRGHQGSRPRRQTTNSYRLLVTPGSATLNPRLRLTPAPGVTASEETAAQTPVSPDFVTPLEGKEPADGGYKGVDEGEHELAPIDIAVVLDVGGQHEPSWADLHLDRDQILGQLRGQLGEVQVLGTVSNDDPERDAKLSALHANGTPQATPRWSNRRPSYKPAGKDTRRLPLAGDLEDFHAAIDALDDDTVHWNYFRNLPDHRRPAR